MSKGRGIHGLSFVKLMTLLNKFGIHTGKHKFNIQMVDMYVERVCDKN